MNETKRKILVGVFASALLHFKVTLNAGIEDTIIPPSPEESKRAYENDNTIHLFTNALVKSVETIESVKQEDIENFISAFKN